MAEKNDGAWTYSASYQIDVDAVQVNTGFGKGSAQERFTALEGIAVAGRPFRTLALERRSETERVLPAIRLIVGA